MKNIKTFLLGSAAALVVATGAQAADPIFGEVKAPREPVYRCDITGFIELPGTDVCLRVGGFARFEAAVFGKKLLGTGGRATPSAIAVDGYNATGGNSWLWGNNNSSSWMRGTGRFLFDARTQTEFGTLRGFVEFQASSGGSGAEGNTGGQPGLRHAYVQLGNWTFGKTNSTFLHSASGPNFIAAIATPTGDLTQRRTQVRYTQALGGGISASIALENQNWNRPAGILAPNFGPGNRAPVGPVGGAFVGAFNDRNDLPDLVGNINVRGGWGEAQLSGALHQIKTRETLAYPGLAATRVIGGPNGPGATDSDLGFAVLFGLALNMPTGPGDVFTFRAAYSDGANQYADSMFATGINAVWGNCGTVAAGGPNCIVDTVKTWSVMASYTHNLTSTFSATLGGGYGENDYRVPGTALLFVGNTGTGDLYTAPVALSQKAKIDQWTIFGNVEWRPVSRLSVMFDVHYNHLDYNGIDQVPTFLRPGIQDSQGEWAFGMQIQRNF